MNVIEISGLTKTYKGGWFSKKKNPSLDHLDLAVPAGKIFGFLGPNGAGESTTIKILLGLVHPTGGTAKILGEPITNNDVRSRIGYLPENPSFPSHLRAGEFLRIMAKIHKVNGDDIAARVDTCLALTRDGQPSFSPWQPMSWTVAICREKRAKGVEPSTFGLESRHSAN